ncbi:MAG: PAS domain S-box protein [Capsulimonas sp.]|uniref:PAS domain S-box protein n=1 Tax=Capsulimonas sp. TaxID=2494211 RepID=UPI003263B63E
MFETVGHNDVVMKIFPIDERIGLEASLDYLETILTHDSAGFVFLDTDLRYVRVNRRLSEINGLAMETYVGRHVSTAVHPDQWPERKTILERALAGEATLDERRSPITAPITDAQRHVLVSYYPVTSSQGVIGVAVVVRDITEQVAAETKTGHLALAFENTSDCLLITNLDGVILQVNDAFVALTGYPREEIIGNSANVLHQPVSSGPLIADILDGLQHNGRWWGDIPLVHKNGSTLYTETSITALLDQDGALIGAINACRDVTSRIHSAQVLRETQMRKDAILDAALDAVITIDEEERVLEWNPAAEKTFGYSRSEALGELLSSLIIPEYLRDAHARGIAHYLKTGEGPALFKRIEVPALRRDGSEFAAELTALPIDLPGRSLFTAFVRDISERKQAEAALEAAVERQHTLLRDVLVSVTEGKLCLLGGEEQLPVMIETVGDPIALTVTEGLRELRAATMDAARQAGFVSERQYDLMTAASEAGMNAIVHGGGGTAQIGLGADGAVQVRVTDQGTGIALENLPQATLARGFSTKATLGHGLKMMLETIDRLSLLTGPGGTVIALEQYAERPLPSWLTL